jgi:hypothetical protein
MFKVQKSLSLRLTSQHSLKNYNLIIYAYRNSVFLHSSPGGIGSHWRCCPIVLNNSCKIHIAVEQHHFLRIRIRQQFFRIQLNVDVDLFSKEIRINTRTWVKCLYYGFFYISYPARPPRPRYRWYFWDSLSVEPSPEQIYTKLLVTLTG